MHKKSGCVRRRRALGLAADCHTSFSPQGSKPAARHFQSNVSVEELLSCHLDVEGFFQLELLPALSITLVLSHSLGRSGNIPTRPYHELRPSGSQPPRIYGLPKVHKPEVPLRPIASCIGSPSYCLSKFITSLISPLGGKTSTHVKNSKHFLEAVQDV